MPRGRSHSWFSAPAHRAERALLLVTLSWGLTFPLVKAALADAPAFPFLGVRTALGLGCLAVFCRFRRPQLSALPAGALLGLLLVASYATQTLGLEHTSATRSAFITGLCVVLVPLLYPILTRRGPGWWASLGAVIALGGLWLLTRPERGGMNRGDLWTLGCAVAYALYIIVLEMVSSRHALMDLVLVQGVVLALCFAPFAVTGWADLRWGNGLVWGLAVTAPILAATLYGLTRHQGGTSATRAAVIYAMEPVFAAVFAWILLGDRLSALEWGGGALIVGGVLTAVCGRRLTQPGYSK